MSEIEAPDTVTLRRIGLRLEEASAKPDLTIEQARHVLLQAAKVVEADADMIDLLWSIRAR